MVTVGRVLVGLTKIGVLLVGVWVFAPEHVWGVAAAVVPLFALLWVMGQVIDDFDDCLLKYSSDRRDYGIGAVLVLLVFPWGALLAVTVFDADFTRWVHMALVFGLLVLSAPAGVFWGALSVLVKIVRYRDEEEEQGKEVVSGAVSC